MEESKEEKPSRTSQFSRYSQKLIDNFTNPSYGYFAQFVEPINVIAPQDFRREFSAMLKEKIMENFNADMEANEVCNLLDSLDEQIERCEQLYGPDPPCWRPSGIPNLDVEAHLAGPLRGYVAKLKEEVSRLEPEVKRERKKILEKRKWLQTNLIPAFSAVSEKLPKCPVDSTERDQRLASKLKRIEEFCRHNHDFENCRK